MVVQRTFGQTHHHAVSVVFSRVDRIVRHGLAVFDDHHGELGCVGGHQICVGDAGTIAVGGFRHFNIKSTDVLPCEFSVQDVSLYFCPRIIAPARLS